MNVNFVTSRIAAAMLLIFFSGAAFAYRCQTDANNCSGTATFTNTTGGPKCCIVKHKSGATSNFCVPQGKTEGVQVGPGATYYCHLKNERLQPSDAIFYIKLD
jgi:hypothetical protein